MQYLPTAEEQKWLTHYLRRLVQRMGYEQLVCAPILLPDRRWFPEPWSRTIRDAHFVTQRLMHYAGLKLQVSIEGFVERDDLDTADNDAAGYFAGIDDGRAFFGLKLATLDDPEIAAGTMAHEVAHAWRAHHHLFLEDARDRDELLTDVTTVYLGFGVLTTNDTHRYRTEGGYDHQRWSTSAYGYLPMQAMSYLLGLQLAARGRSEEIREVERQLEPNQGRCVRETLEALESKNILEMLALPPRAKWPPPRTEPETIRLHEPEEQDAFEPELEDVQWNAGERIFRVGGRNLWSAIMLGAIIGFVPGVIAGMVLANLGIIDEILWPIALGCILGIAVVLRHKPRYVCSDSECNAVMPKPVAVCPGCGGTVAGTVRERQLPRLLEEELERKAAQMEFEDCAACAPENPCARHA